MPKTFIKDEERYADWFLMVKHAIAKSKYGHLNWSCYRNSGLENKHSKGVVIINTGSRQAVITATIQELKTDDDLIGLAIKRTKDALLDLMFVRQPANDSRETPTLSRDKLGRIRKPSKPKPRKRKRQLVPG